MRYLATVLFPLFSQRCSSEDVPPCAQVQERRDVSELLLKDYSCVFAGDKPVIVDVGATWCGPCNAMRPHIESFQTLYPEVRVVRVTTDTNPEEEALLEKMHVGTIDAIPTLLFVSSHDLASLRGARRLSGIIAAAEKAFPLAKKNPDVLKERVAGNYLLQKGLFDDVLYLKDFTLDDVVEMTACDMPPTVANPYGERFFGSSICWMYNEKHIDAAYAQRYPVSCTGAQVMDFLKRNIPPEKADCPEQ